MKIELKQYLILKDGGPPEVHDITGKIKKNFSKPVLIDLLHGPLITFSYESIQIECKSIIEDPDTNQVDQYWEPIE